MYCAFPVGYMIFSTITFYTKNVPLLTYICLGTNMIGGLAPCVFLQESPMYLFEMKAEPSKILRVMSKIRSINGQKANDELLSQLSTDLQARNEVEKNQAQLVRKTSVKGKEESSNEKSILGKFFCTWKYLFQFIALSLIGGMMNCVYFAITLKISKLTSASITVNGLIFAGISLVSTLLMLPFGASLPRKLLLLLGQLVIMASCLVLFVFDLFDLKTGVTIDVIKGVIIAVVIGGVMYAMFTPYIYFVSELFPADLRGTANALTNFFSMLLSMSAPFLFKFGDDRGFNGIEATSILGLVSLPLTFFLRETVGG